MIKTSCALTDKQKAEAEYWGIFGMAPAPELIEMTKFVSDTNDLRLDDDVKLFFVASNAIFDASIAAWDAKYGYDYVRPITAIRALGDTLISAWRPRSLAVLAYATPAALAEAEDSVIVPAGLGEVRAADWEPYLPTPPFPSYVSGHSVFTAAWARAMELATGKPDFNFKKTVRHLYVEQRELAYLSRFPIRPSQPPPKPPGSLAYGPVFIGRRTMNVASSSVERSARTFGGALSNSSLARRPRPQRFRGAAPAFLVPRQ